MAYIANRAEEVGLAKEASSSRSAAADVGKEEGVSEGNFVDQGEVAGEQGEEVAVIPT